MTAGRVAVLLLALLGATACGGGGDGELSASTTSAGTTTAKRGDCRPGVYRFKLRNGQAAAMRVTPPGPRPYALIASLHGSGGTPEGALEAFAGAIPGLVVVAPASKGRTWSVILSQQDADLESVDLAVAEAWARCDLDRKRLALGGFSDGATYALTLGVANGDLFPAIIAFSPGGIVADARRGAPRIFVSHGTEDDVLPIAGASDTIVPQLREVGFDVTYRRFRGGHEVAPATSAAAVRWFLAGL